jgi:hypothetical protein
MAQENVEIVRLAWETWERGDLTGWLKIEKFHKQGKKTPPWLKTDKPWDDPDVTGKPVSVTVQIPPLDSLVHDAAHFRAIKEAPLHGKLLDGLRSYYFNL